MIRKILLILGITGVFTFLSMKSVFPRQVSESIEIPGILSVSRDLLFETFSPEEKEALIEKEKEPRRIQTSFKRGSRKAQSPS
jgi:hypothetical protein